MISSSLLFLACRDQYSPRLKRSMCVWVNLRVSMILKKPRKRHLMGEGANIKVTRHGTPSQHSSYILSQVSLSWLYAIHDLGIRRGLPTACILGPDITLLENWSGKFDSSILLIKIQWNLSAICHQCIDTHLLPFGKPPRVPHLIMQYVSMDVMAINSKRYCKYGAWMILDLSSSFANRQHDVKSLLYTRVGYIPWRNILRLPRGWPAMTPACL